MDTILTDINRLNVTKDEICQLEKDREEQRVWTAQCARHGMDKSKLSSDSVFVTH